MFLVPLSVSFPAITKAMCFQSPQPRAAPITLACLAPMGTCVQVGVCLGFWEIRLSQICQILIRETTVMFLCMYEHMFVVVGSGAVSKKKDALTFTNQSHVRPKNPPKPSPAAALRRTPSAGHSGRTGPQNNPKVRLIGVRHQTVCIV